SGPAATWFCRAASDGSGDAEGPESAVVNPPVRLWIGLGYRPLHRLRPACGRFRSRVLKVFHSHGTTPWFGLGQSIGIASGKRRRPGRVRVFGKLRIPPVEFQHSPDQPQLFPESQLRFHNADSTTTSLLLFRSTDPMTEAWHPSDEHPHTAFGLPQSDNELSDSVLCARIRRHRPDSPAGRAAFGELYARHQLPALHFA